jgi:hypothetical protein
MPEQQFCNPIVFFCSKSSMVALFITINLAGMKSSVFKAIFAWIVGISFVTLGIYLFRMVFITGINEEFLEIYETHFTALVGLPAAAFISTFLILLLQIVKKEPLEFEMIGIKFKGSSGEIVLWVFVYLSIVVSIKLLW